MNSRALNWTELLLKKLLEHPVDALPWWQRIPAQATRVFFALARDIAEGDLTLYASSLSYTTLLAVVPFFAVSFWVLTAFGVHNQMEPVLSHLLAPLGAGGDQVAQRIIGFVEGMDFNVLGFVGLAMLLYTVISLMMKIEQAFNFIWQVREHRGFLLRFGVYVSAILVGPILVFSAIGVMASILNTSLMHSVTAAEPVGNAIHWASRMAPISLITIAFTLIILVIPNTRIKRSSALLGGLISGLLWESTGWMFASFVVTSGNYAAIYSTFATLVLFLIWLYLGWLILLIGAGISFYHQNPSLLRFRHRTLELGKRNLEKVALMLVHLVGTHFYERKKPWTVEALSHRLNLPRPILQSVVDSLVAANILMEFEESDGTEALVPAEPFEEARLTDLFRAISTNQSHEEDFQDLHPPLAQDLLQQRDEAQANLMGQYKLSDLVLRSSSPEETPAASTQRNVP